MGNCANKTQPQHHRDDANVSVKGWRAQNTAGNSPFTIHSAYDERDDEYDDDEPLDKIYDTSRDWYELPRGGYVVKTSEGLVQFGMPPETIKDSMKLGTEVPTTYVVYGEMFNRVMGISIAEFEFPTYFNFFIKRKQVKLLTTIDREKRILKVFRETLLGPEKYQIAEDFPPGTSADAFPRFKEEGEALDSFRKGLTISKLIQFERFAADGKVSVG